MADCSDCSIRVYQSFQSEWQHETTIWEGLPALYHSILLYFILSIAIVTN